MKEFAILGPVSEIAARAALASQKQGKYEDFHKEFSGPKHFKPTAAGRVQRRRVVDRDYDRHVREELLHEGFLQCAEEAPQACAVVGLGDGHRLSYAELEHVSRAIARSIGQVVNGDKAVVAVETAKVSGKSDVPIPPTFLPLPQRKNQARLVPVEVLVSSREGF